MGPEMFQAQVADQFGLELSLEVVRDMIAKFFGLFEGVAAFHERAEVSAQSATFTRTIPLGRRRWLPKELYWNTKRKLLINTPIQGSATDCFKLAVVNVANLLPRDAYLVNLLHDEIIVEAQESVVGQAAQALEKGMTAAYVDLFDTRIPLTVRATISERWQKS
jgi:DNA polymerase-1